MAWVTPRTWTILEIVTAAELNEQVRDNLNYLYQANQPHGCRIYRITTALSVSDNTPTLVNFNTEFEDTDAYHSVLSNTDQIVIPASLGGIYDFSGVIGWDGNATGYRQVNLLKNSSIVAYSTVNGNASGNAHNFSFTGIRAVATDVFQIQVKQTSGGSLNVSVGLSYSTWVSAWLHGVGS